MPKTQQEMDAESMTCPRCGNECMRDSADVGVGTIYGPWGCPCGWSEDSRYDTTAGPRVDGHGYRIDPWGGAAPPGGYGTTPC